jgi:phage virion morphogenesis protein
MASGVRYELKGSEKALEHLDAVLKQTDDKKGLFDAIGAALVTSTAYRFEEGVGPDGYPWKTSFRVKRRGGKTLIDSGRMLNSITHNATAEMVEVGTNVIYAAIHQLGGTIEAKGGKDAYLTFKLADGTFRRTKSVAIPARPFLGLDDDDNKEIVAIADEWLARTLAGPDGGADVR